MYYLHQIFIPSSKYTDCCHVYVCTCMYVDGVQHMYVSLEVMHQKVQHLKQVLYASMHKSMLIRTDIAL